MYKKFRSAFISDEIRKLAKQRGIGWKDKEGMRIVRQEAVNRYNTFMKKNMPR